MRTKALFKPQDLQKNQTYDQIVLDAFDKVEDYSYHQESVLSGILVQWTKMVQYSKVYILARVQNRDVHIKPPETTI